jgi:DNA/RNA-binding domain of Phe-tRNA-synthetase-like protein
MFFDNQLEIKVSQELRKACPGFKGTAVYAAVTNTLHNDALWNEINDFTKELLVSDKMEDIKNQPAIATTRDAYKRCGKDPSRYRPSAEALRRRLLRGLELYQIDTLVDIINLVSLKSGYSIGGFDADKIQGCTLTLGIGKADEPYEGIGRGILNIEGLPVYRDAVGGIGTPTSDNERTKMDMDTRHILAIINAYDGDAECVSTVELMKNLLCKYAGGNQIEIAHF